MRRSQALFQEQNGEAAPAPLSEKAKAEALGLKNRMQLWRMRSGLAPMSPEIARKLAALDRRSTRE